MPQILFIYFNVLMIFFAVKERSERKEIPIKGKKLPTQGANKSKTTN